MEKNDNYDYSLTNRFIQPFNNPFDIPFITDDEESYGTLWEFQSHIESWSFGVHRFKNYVFLQFKIKNQPSYQVMNMKEKVATIEHHHQNYVVIVLREVNDFMEHTDHCHSIVIDVTTFHARFDLENLMMLLEGTKLESLNDHFRDKYLPWKTSDAESMARRLRRFLQTLGHWAQDTVQPEPGLGRRRPQGRRQKSGSTAPRPSAPTTPGSRVKPGTARSEPKKRKAPTGTEGSRKRRKSLAASTTGAGGSSSGLTTNSVGLNAFKGPIPDFEEIGKIQKDFWKDHKDCFLFDMVSVTISIEQCIIASDEYVIRTLQQNMVNDMKRVLVQMVEIGQRQKVCLTPVDGRKKLLKTKPQKWEDIENMQFMIINGQHSITASKQLQDEACDEDRKAELRSWDALIVWTEDPNKLRNISKFYNLINHLHHAQPTWGNQLIACRNIWNILKCPAIDSSEPEVRGNGSVHNENNYKVRLISL